MKTSGAQIAVSEDDTASLPIPAADEIGWPRAAVRAAWVLVGVGIALRLLTFAAPRSLWLDEAMLANNIVTRSPAGLLQKLDNRQAAPPGFLLAEKLVVSLLGVGEKSLRIVPLICALASMPLVFLLLRRRVSPRVGLLTLGMVASCGPLIYYGSEVKQYSMDLVAALGVMVLGERLLSAPAARRAGAYIALGATGTLAVWFSHPVIFVLAGVGAAAFLAAWRRKQSRSMLIIAGTGALWLASFALLYFKFLKPLASDDWLRTYWNSAYPPASYKAVGWLFRYATSMFLLPAGIDTPAIGTVCGLMGLWLLWRRDRVLLALVAGPLAFTLLGAILHLYPFEGRLVLFLVPGWMLLIAVAIAYLWELPQQRGRVFAGVLLTILMVHPIHDLLVWTGLQPMGKLAINSVPPEEEMKPIAVHLAAHAKPGDVVCLHPLTEPAYDFYVRLLHIPPLPKTVLRGQDDLAKLQAEMAPLRAAPRVWFVFSHAWTIDALGGERETCFFLEQLHGRQVEVVRAPGAAVYLYEFQPAAPAGGK